MKWLANLHNPEDENWKKYVAVAPGETQEQAYADYLKWLDGKIIADPEPSDTYTVEQLKAMNIVGVYKDDQS